MYLLERSNFKTVTPNARFVIHCWWDAKWYSHSEQIVWLFLRKLNIFLAYDPSIVLTLEVKISIYTKKLCMAVARSRMQNNTDILIIAMKKYVFSSQGLANNT